MAIEISLGVTKRAERKVRTVEVANVSQAAHHAQGLVLVDIDGTSRNNKTGQEADLHALAQNASRLVRYSSRIPLKPHGLQGKFGDFMHARLPKRLQAWPFITQSLREKVEEHTTEPNSIYGIQKLLLPAQLQRRVWNMATTAIQEGPVTVIGNSRLTDRRLPQALYRYAIKNRLQNSVTFVHVKPERQSFGSFLKGIVTRRRLADPVGVSI